MAESIITINPDGTLNVPETPVIPFIEGDGIGPDIWAAARRVLDAAVAKSLQGHPQHRLAGDPCRREGLRHHRRMAARGDGRGPQEIRGRIKGPLTTPVGDGIRSLNVTLRQVLDLYACVRPVRYYQGVVAPVKDPGAVDMVIFRENTEDVYAGIEWPAGSDRGQPGDRVSAQRPGGGHPRRTPASASSR